MARKSKQKRIHEYFATNDIEYVVIECEHSRSVNLYIHNRHNLLCSLIKIATFVDRNIAKNFLDNIHLMKFF